LSCLSSLTQLQTLELNFACYKVSNRPSNTPLASAAAEAGGADQHKQQQQQPGGNEARSDTLACSSSLREMCCVDGATMHAKAWAGVMAGLQHCGRLRQVVLGQERPFDVQQQTDLQDRLPNCLLFTAWNDDNDDDDDD
jgi:hypothetical protein